MILCKSNPVSIPVLHFNWGTGRQEQGVGEVRGKAIFPFFFLEEHVINILKLHMKCYQLIYFGG